MKETEQIADQLRRAMQGEAWSGPSLREALAGVTAEQAAARPIVGAHSIWELVLHIAAWEAIALRRLRGETVKDIPAEVDWPPVGDTSEAARQRAPSDETVKDVRAEVDWPPVSETRETAWQSTLGRETVKDARSEVSWPPVGETKEATWQRALAALEDGNRKLRDAIAQMPDERLRERVPGKEHSFYGELHGVVQHDLYHAGQIILLKKAAG